MSSLESLVVHRYVDRNGVEHVLEYEPFSRPPDPLPPPPIVFRKLETIEIPKPPEKQHLWQWPDGSFTYQHNGADRYHYYETLKIPTPQPPAPLPQQQYEYLEIPAPKPPSEIVPQKPVYLDVDVGPTPVPGPLPVQHYEYLEPHKLKAPFFDWSVLSSRRLALDYIHEIPSSWMQERWIQPQLSVVVENKTVHLYGHHVTVQAQVSNPGGPILIGKIKIHDSSARAKEKVSLRPLKFSKLVWVNPTKHDYYLEVDDMLVHIYLVQEPYKCLVKVYDADEVQVHERSRTHYFPSKIDPRPFSRGLLRAIRKMRESKQIRR